MLVACKEDKDKEKFEKKDLAPASLTEIGKGIQEILSKVEMVEKLEDMTYMEEAPIEEEGQEDEEKQESTNDVSEEDKKKNKKGDEESRGTQGGEEEGQEESQGEQTEEKSNEDKRKGELQKNWTEINNGLKGVHENWNAYETDHEKKAISPEKLEQFRANLNVFTKSIEDKDIIDIYQDGGICLLNLGPFFDVFKDDISGEINELRYKIYSSYGKFLDGQGEAATEPLESADENINSIRLKLKEDDSKIKILDKINLAVKDMEKSLGEDSLKLVRIKKDMVVNQLKELER